jgi:hypothetical protein
VQRLGRQARLKAAARNCRAAVAVAPCIGVTAMAQDVANQRFKS